MLLDEISTKRLNARRDDIGTLKPLISTLIAPEPHIKALDPPLTNGSSKSDRGINHPIIASLFCPRAHVFRMLQELEREGKTFDVHGDDSSEEEEEEEEDNEEEDEVEEHSQDSGNDYNESQDEERPHGKRIIPNSTTVVSYIQGGGLELTADGLDAFLYDLRKIEPGRSRRQELKGLLRGYTLLRAYRAIFLGPTSMMEDPGTNSRPSLAKIHHLTRVTPKTVAYACVIARYTMSSVESWKELDQDYSLRELYDFIVALLSTPDSVFAKNTLAWWNRKVFGLKKIKAKRVAQKDVIPAKSRFNKLIAAENACSKRKAQKAEREEAERRAAEEVAKRKAYDDLRAERERRRQRKAASRDIDTDRSSAIDEGSSMDEGNDTAEGEVGEGGDEDEGDVDAAVCGDGDELEDEGTPQDIHEDTRTRRQGARSQATRSARYTQGTQDVGEGTQGNRKTRRSY
ncbi:hypothetical protein K435DRAFT_864218 [Dendrothele bispora CBS 962.96]|uniref:Uncharacterized protein n=1 Tax=Dendrothele bispora (strain CBS 962.96) TaxID=1314807 RepID=A0A4S8LMR0_DENBC|nr:hypothetical protein K435DRAFT_864218 [Dendrothele bispora CBS 962.96]